MAKYVCDYDMVDTIANNVKNLANNMKDTAANYEATITSDLATWSGEAKENFMASNQEQVIVINKNLDSAIEMAEFIIKAAQAIEQTDAELATLTI